MKLKSQTTLTNALSVWGKKQDYRHKDLLQHATAISASSNREAKVKADHRSLAKFLKNDLSESSASLQQMVVEPEPPKPIYNHFVFPWMGVLVSVPTEFKNGRHVGEGGTRTKEQLSRFNPLMVIPLWNYNGHSGNSIVVFSKDWSGFKDAMAFENHFEAKHLGKRDWYAKKNHAPEIYGWVARADDYNSGGPIGDHLRKNGDLKTVADLTMEESHKTDKLVANLANEIEARNKYLQDLECKYNETNLSLDKAMEEELMLKAYNIGLVGNGFTQLDAQLDREALTGTFLKLLHGLLVKLSPNEFLSQDVYGCTLSMCVSNQLFIVKIKYADIIDLSNLLYDKLHNQFEWLIFGTRHLPAVVVSGENGCITADAKFSPVEFFLLLRCSMIILQFLAFNLTLVLERCQILVALLEKLCPPNSPQQFCHVDAVASEAGIPTSFASAILEVFLDEFLLHHDLREYCIMTGCARATKENPFLSKSHGEVQVITEVVSSHFLLAVFGESAFERFVSSLSWSNEIHDRIPALGLGSSLALLSHPVMFTAPYLMQAHVILLASRCIGIHMPTDAKKLDELEMKLHILAFELSVKLYSGFIPNLKLFYCIPRDENKSSFGAKGPTFTSCIRSLTSDRLSQQIDRLIDPCHLPSYGLHSGARAELLDNSIAYIKGNQNFIDETFREEACSILTCIVKSILSRESELLYEDKDSIRQEMCCVAAVLKLMSSALLQIVWHMGQKGYSGGTRAPKQLLFCKECDFISEIIHSFGNYGGNRHIQKILFGTTESNVGKIKDIKLIFSHFASLLLYSFRNRADFLWKGCIFMMIPLMNLLIIEAGNLDAFRPFLCKMKKSTFPHTSQDLFHELSSITIAGNIKKLRDQIKYRRHEDHSMGDGEIAEVEATDDRSNASNTFQNNCVEKRGNTCTADIFFKSLRGSQSKQAEWEDLDDFVACSSGKDYSSWLEKRSKFRKWKYKRMLFMKHNIRKSMRSRRSPNFAYFR